MSAQLALVAFFLAMLALPMIIIVVFVISRRVRQRNVVVERQVRRTNTEAMGLVTAGDGSQGKPTAKRQKSSAPATYGVSRYHRVESGR